MKYAENRAAVEKLPVDLLGYIFYPQSQRFVGEIPETGLFNSKKPKVGVFVDENAFEILSLSKNFGFDFVQLHGKENPQTCQIIKSQGLQVIKSFNIDNSFDFNSIIPYEKNVKYLLFDTKTKLHGGSGQKFDWNILENYNGHVPFFISGGIGFHDAQIIKQFKHPKLAGVDLNSGFEDVPGVKNFEKLEKFIFELKNPDTQI